MSEEKEVIENPINFSKDDFIKWAKKVLSKPPKKEIIGMVLKRDYDLRASLDMKIFDASDMARWTAFVNRTGKLCHVVSPEGELMIRITFPYGIQHLSEWQMHKSVYERIKDYVRV
jgi:hypothetical protein